MFKTIFVKFLLFDNSEYISKEFPAHLVKWVEYGAQAQEPPGKPTAPVIPPAKQNQTSSAPMAPPSQVGIL